MVISEKIAMYNVMKVVILLIQTAEKKMATVRNVIFLIMEKNANTKPM